MVIMQNFIMQSLTDFILQYTVRSFGPPTQYTNAQFLPVFRVFHGDHAQLSHAR